MKVLFIFVAVLSIALVCGSEDEMKKMFITIATDCKGREGASDDDMANLAAKKPPTSPEGKCVLACIFETIGVVSSWWLTSVRKFSFKEKTFHR